jgi:hypothetical protein
MVLMVVCKSNRGATARSLKHMWDILRIENKLFRYVCMYMYVGECGTMMTYSMYIDVGESICKTIGAG